MQEQGAEFEPKTFVFTDSLQSLLQHVKNACQYQMDIQTIQKAAKIFFTMMDQSDDGSCMHASYMPNACSMQACMHAACKIHAACMRHTAFMQYAAFMQHVACMQHAYSLHVVYSTQHTARMRHTAFL